jgi:hypothetical protein
MKTLSDLRTKERRRRRKPRFVRTVDVYDGLKRDESVDYRSSLGLMIALTRDQEDGSARTAVIEGNARVRMTSGVCGESPRKRERNANRFCLVSANADGVAR